MNDALNALPAYLRNRNGRLELVLHCTWVQDYDICSHKFWLRYGEQVEGTGPRAALNYGAAIHGAMEIRSLWQLHGGYDTKNDLVDLAEIERQQHMWLDAHFDLTPNPPDDYRNAQRAKDLIAAYNAEYPSHDWQVLAVEEEFEVEVGVIELPPGMADTMDTRKPIDEWIQAHVPVYLAGRKDLVVAWHDGVWVVDHKTAQDWGKGDSNSHLDEGRMSFQFRGYAWAERARQATHCSGCGNEIDPTTCHCGDYIKNHGYSSGHGPVPMGCTCGYADQSNMPKATPRERLPVLGTVGNYLVSRRPYAVVPKKPEPRNVFHQEAYPFSATTLDEWREECLGVAAEILRSHAAGYFRRKRSGCGHWGRCEFYDYCEAKPEDRAGLLASTLFQPKTIERDL